MAATIEELIHWCRFPPDLDINYRGRSTGKPTPDWLFVPTDGYQKLAPTICLGYSWTSQHPGRYLEIWSVDGKKHLLTMRHHGDRRAKAELCQKAWLASLTDKTGTMTLDPWTVDIPQLTDIFKWPGFSDTKEVRRERARRITSQNSAVPKFLQWLPPLLTQLDNAQDMIYTGLALAYPLVKYLFPRLLGGWGIMLGVSDMLNIFT